ncbi:hypothetical protein Nepgr_005939 [Nepenthes gracilis]|uniref:Protein BIG GRAIN 1-like B n=1 Tax=Nepenthes gracilis TaxID=150966 RepID=A0AAD3S4G4_NEPGR|nr:hypothetical protein Nepgr_005939 [Nepenthes gracilis]
MSKLDSQKRRTKSPSFSSILLDAIYRSIDIEESYGTQEDNNCSFFLSASEKQRCNKKSDGVVTTTAAAAAAAAAFGFRGENVNLRRAMMIENWMDKQQRESDDTVRMLRQQSVPSRNVSGRRSSVFFNSTASSSSESSSAGHFSSTSETDFSSCIKQQKPARIRTYFAPRSERSDDCLRFEHLPIKREGRFAKTKSQALKIYGDLKKVKQPISPGGRITSFLNSIFNAKKPNITASEMRSDQNSKLSSSASSSSRSCLSKTPSSRGKSSSGVKRSVRFYPVSVIVDEDSRPCGHKCLHEDEPKRFPSINAKKSAKIATKNNNNTTLCSPSCDARKWNSEWEDIDMAMGGSMTVTSTCKKKSPTAKVELREVDSSEELVDDAESCASSDLFELDNLSSIGIEGRYNEELPVYGTTRMVQNQAIANGFIV